MKKFILTFDIEEFDIVDEFKIKFSEKHKVEEEGLKKIIEFLKFHKIPATCFITKYFAQNHKELIKELSKISEIGLHGYTHQDNYSKMSKKEILEKLSNARKYLEKLSGKPVIGFRSPRMQKIDEKILKEIGIKYNSSLHPTYVLGRYNNMFKNRHPEKKEIFSIPISVAPLLRLPFTWIFFRNLPLIYSKICTSLNYLNSDYALIYFHEWELTKINLKGFAFKKTGNKLITKLTKYINWLKNKNIKFIKMSSYYYSNFVQSSS